MEELITWSKGVYSITCDQDPSVSIRHEDCSVVYEICVDGEPRISLEVLGAYEQRDGWKYAYKLAAMFVEVQDK